MDIRILQYYLTVAREENITRAAQSLHLTQPTLSRQMMQLEEELGVQLFVRGRRSIFLTEDGMLFKRRAQEIVSLAEKAVQELNTQSPVSGEIAVGGGELLAFSWLAGAMTAFRREYPLVRFHLQSGNADVVKEGIERGLIDVGLVLVPVDIGKYDFLEVPGEETWGVYVHEDLPLAQRQSAAKDDLLGEKILMTRRELVQSAISRWFGTEYEQLRIIGTYDLLGNAAVLVQQKAGIAVGLARNCTYDHVRFLPFSPPLTANTMLIWKKGQSVSPAVGAFVEYAQKYKNRMVQD